MTMTKDLKATKLALFSKDHRETCKLVKEVDDKVYLDNNIQ